MVGGDCVCCRDKSAEGIIVFSGPRLPAKNSHTPTGLIDRITGLPKRSPPSRGSTRNRPVLFSDRPIMTLSMRLSPGVAV